MPFRTPSYRLHKSSGLAVVRLNGTDVYLGQYGTSESKAEYDRTIAEWLAAGRQLPQRKAALSLTVAEALDRYLAFAATYYRQPDESGRLVPTNHLSRVEQALRPVRRLYGGTPVERFGPLALQAVQAEMIRMQWCRKYINSQADCIKRAFRWLVSQELAPAAVAEGLRCVPGLRFGRSEAIESEDVRPAPEAHVDAVRAIVSLHVRCLIDLQLLTGARPGEVCSIRPGEIDQAGKVWVYRPVTHKMAHKGKERRIWIGPQAQAILLPFLDREADRFCFVPAESAAAHYEAQGMTSSRARALGQLYRHPRFTTGGYGDLIRLGCKRAKIDPTWHSHQLRHNAATRLVAEFGWDVARIILGHATLSATRIYGEDDMAKAVEAIGKVG